MIERDGYTLAAFELRGGVCRHCRTPIAGRFDDTPGDWGGRRLPVRIAAYARPVSARRPNRKTETPGRPANLPAAPKPLADRGNRPRLTEEQEKLVFHAASRRVAEVVRLQALEPVETLLAEVGSTAVYGAFVSLKRGGQLRSCCGFLGQSVPLAEALGHAAVRAAKDDPRFPPISPSELEHLDMEVWLLWGLEPVAAKGEDRVGAVTIGTHGLQIARGPRADCCCRAWPSNISSTPGLS